MSAPTGATSWRADPMVGGSSLHLADKLGLAVTWRPNRSVREEASCQ